MLDRSLTSRHILQLLSNGESYSAKEIVNLLSVHFGLDVSKSTVNSVLYGLLLSSQVACDNDYRWSTNLQPTLTASPEPVASPKNIANGKELERVCAYYLRCLQYERDGEISLSPNRDGAKDLYFQITANPESSADMAKVWQQPQAMEFLSFLRKSPKRNLLYVGYPVFVRPGRNGPSLEPLFLFAFSYEDRGSSTPILLKEPPRLNMAAFSGYGDVSDEHLFEEMQHLRKQLGLDAEAGALPSLEDWIPRLKHLRPEWPWAEEIDPSEIRTDAIEKVEASKIHNCAIVFRNSEAKYTRGLESEIEQLAAYSSKPGFRDSALHAILNPQAVKTHEEDKSLLLEMMSINQEQRLAVQSALTRKVTVITGPPGTGKSQVVSAILANASYRGWSSIITSRNNKAVDVVESRANSLAKPPFVLRLGGTSGSATLAQQIRQILSGGKTSADSASAGLLQEYQTLVRERDQRESDIQQTIEIRNQVDQLDRELSSIRRKYEADELIALQNFSRLEELQKKLKRALESCDPYKCSFVTRLLWGIVSARRNAALERETSEVVDELKTNGLGQFMPSSLVAVDILNQLQEYASAQKLMATYLERLEELKRRPSLESSYRKLREVQKILISKGAQVWNEFLSLRFSKLTSSDRRILGEYATLMNLVTEAGTSRGTFTDGIRRQLKDTAAKASKYFTCSAITSLSVNGRLAFTPASIDLVVIDEASQCDIASALPLLIRAKRIVVIGDPQQLGHITQISSRLDACLLQQYGLQGSSTWSYGRNSLYHFVAAHCGSDDVVKLVEHHRSSHDIIAFSNSHFYGGELRVATSARTVIGANAVEWINVRGRVEQVAGRGSVNHQEAAAVVQFLENYLVGQSRVGSVGVVTPFRSQANRIRTLLNESKKLEEISGRILVDTVHKFQGDERDLMVFSPTVANGMSEGSVRFLASQGNLFNVAVTRARSKLVVVGDQAACSQSKISYLSAFVDYAAKLNSKATGSLVTQLHSPEYPEVTDQNLVSDWERQFYKALYAAGIRPLPQYQVDEFRLDFAVSSGGKWLNIEIDGEQYHRNWDNDLLLRDQLRNRRLNEQGWAVIRFWVYEIRDQEQDCIKRVADWIKKAA